MKLDKKRQKKEQQNIHVRHADRFNQSFQTDADCLRGLWQFVYHTDIAHCLSCNTAQPDFEFDSRTFKCVNCHRKNFVTAGTIFENIREPRPWLARIWFYENGIEISSNQFSKLFGIVSSSALNIFKKIMISVVDLLPGEPDVASSDFESVLTKRSSETPANEHPRSELKPMVEEDSACEVMPELDENDARVLELLPAGARLNTDELAFRSNLGISELSVSLWVLADIGLVKRLPGDLHERVSKIPRTSISTCVPERSVKIIAATKFIRRIHQGVSRKCLQLYLCSYAITANRRKWASDALLQVCRRAEISDASVRAYVSPQFLKVA